MGGGRKCVRERPVRAALAELAGCPRTFGSKLTLRDPSLVKRQESGYVFFFFGTHAISMHNVSLGSEKRRDGGA